MRVTCTFPESKKLWANVRSEEERKHTAALDATKLSRNSYAFLLDHMFPRLVLSAGLLFSIHNFITEKEFLSYVLPGKGLKSLAK